MASNNTWYLQKYARFVGEKSGSPESWKFYDSEHGSLQLQLTETHHLVVTHGQQILENHSLWNAMSWMKGVSKGDSMLLICKVQDESYKFRVKFAHVGDKDGMETCSGCILILAHFLPIRRINVQGEEETLPRPSQSGQAEQGEKVEGDVSIGKLAEVLSSGHGSLPSAYRHSNIDLPESSLQGLLHLCLTDANFPAFVGQVEKQLDKIKKEKSG